MVAALGLELSCCCCLRSGAVMIAFRIHVSGHGKAQHKLNHSVEKHINIHTHTHTKPVVFLVDAYKQLSFYQPPRHVHAPDRTLGECALPEGKVCRRQSPPRSRAAQATASGKSAQKVVLDKTLSEGRLLNNTCEY